MAVTRSFGAILSGELAAVRREIEKRRDESIERLQEWIRHPSVAAEDRGMDEGCALMLRLVLKRELTFQIQ